MRVRRLSASVGRLWATESRLCAQLSDEGRATPAWLQGGLISEREADALKPILDASGVPPSEEAQVKEAEVARCLALMSAEMVAAVSKMTAAELDGVARAQAVPRDEVELRLVAETFRKSSISQLRCARYAVQRLRDFASSLGLESPRLDHSPGFLALFLSGQLAPSMPATLLREKFVPAHLKSIFVNLCAFAWSIALSFILAGT